MNQATIALILSSLSIGIALTSLFWNIYKELLLRPRSFVVCGVSNIYHGGKTLGPFIDLRLTNRGPGKLVITNIVFFEGGFFRKLVGLQKMATINYDYENPYNSKLPEEVEQYHSYVQYLNYEKDCFLEQKVTRFGFIDPMNRYHWAKRRYLRKLRCRFEKDFREQRETNN